MLVKAIQIVVSAHKEQVDKSGQPYILHLIRVMDAGETEQEKICGVLHDLVEDTDWTFENKLPFPACCCARVCPVDKPVL